VKAKTKNTLRTGLVAIAALAVVGLYACGSDDDGATASSTAPETVAVKSIGDAGEVLVDSNGVALYSPDQEANGKILCTGGCEAIWKPLSAGSGEPTASSDIGGELGTVKRPDGSQQVTFDGAPLYTFTEEGPGEVTGDGFSDAFGGQQFTWHVAQPSGASGSGSTTTTDDSSGGYSY
jgi:predicted lipoprotein with Yx(FWY)xxD motif